jgi:LPS-assembly lipoprotein
MSWFEGVKTRRTSFALLLALTVASGCTVQPLYRGGDNSLDLKAPTIGGLAAARGRIGVSAVNDRTAQIVRNQLIFSLNGGREPVSPLLYEIRPIVRGDETIVSIQRGSGVPSASLYRVNVTYQVIRISDSQVIATGTRFASTPFDRSEQLFASSRAVQDARETAGKEVAERVALAVANAIARDLEGRR